MLSKGGQNIKLGEYKNYIGGYFLLLDMTDKGFLTEAMANGSPWLLSKGQDKFLVLSDFIPIEEIDDPHNVDLELRIN
jgi:acylpyruvate hydrolase